MYKIKLQVGRNLNRFEGNFTSELSTPRPNLQLDNVLIIIRKDVRNNKNLR